MIFITLTNNGYLDYTRNCITSLKKCSYEGNLDCFCIDDECYDNLKKTHKFVHKLENNEKIDFCPNYGRHKWTNIVFQKFYAIYQCLLNYDYVLFTDGDIVFKNKDFINYCYDNINDNDLLIQNNKQTNDNCNDLCTGFMFIKSNETTLNIFNPDNIIKNHGHCDDQWYVNIMKKHLKYKLFPLELFPNGKFFIDNYENINPYIIHFNWLVGNQKKEKMIKYNVWY